ncbi:MAG: hypothetical protein HS118_10190 [Bacteroidia bacterium]|nr:hypothetical protein [Bacteroidia bacterium]
MKKVTKQFLLLAAAGMILTSCQNGSNTKTDAAKDSTASATSAASTEKMDYPYTIKHPDNWDIGSQQNTLIALSALKAWENQNMDESLKYFADSVDISFDGMSKKVSKDTLRAIIAPSEAPKSIKIKMEDWLSSISKDKQDEWVSLWYTQYIEKANGTTDSVDVFDDIKMKDGKIIRLDEYRRKL